MIPTNDGRTRIDLSHPIEDGMTTYPGLPTPIVCDYISRERSRTIYAPGTEFQIGGVEAFAGRNVAGKAVLVRTGWDRHWRTPEYLTSHPFLNEEAAAFLVAAGATLVGIDSLNIDSTSTGERPVHSTLLAAGIPICEHLAALGPLPDDGFRFSAVPAPIKGMGTFPVRAYATIDAVRT